MKKRKGNAENEDCLTEQDRISRTWKVNPHQCPEEEVPSHKKRRSLTSSLLMVSNRCCKMNAGGGWTQDDLGECVTIMKKVRRLPNMCGAQYLVFLGLFQNLDGRNGRRPDVLRAQNCLSGGF